MVTTVDHQLRHSLSLEAIDLVRICVNSSRLQHLYSTGYHTAAEVPTGARNVRVAETTSNPNTYLGMLAHKHLSGVSIV